MRRSQITLGVVGLAAGALLTTLLVWPQDAETPRPAPSVVALDLSSARSLEQIRADTVRVAGGSAALLEETDAASCSGLHGVSAHRARNQLLLEAQAAAVLGLLEYENADTLTSLAIRQAPFRIETSFTDGRFPEGIDVGSLAGLIEVRASTLTAVELGRESPLVADALRAAGIEPYLTSNAITETIAVLVPEDDHAFAKAVLSGLSTVAKVTLGVAENPATSVTAT